MDAGPRWQASGQDDQAGSSADHASAAQESRLLTRPGSGDRQTGRARMNPRRATIMDLTARIRSEEGAYWADVAELPGCFASGDTLDELFESLREGIALCLEDGGRQGGQLRVATATLTDRPLTAA
jgi:predicted RNase H-like HicB family nuclease